MKLMAVCRSPQNDRRPVKYGDHQKRQFVVECLQKSQTMLQRRLLIPEAVPGQSQKALIDNYEYVIRRGAKRSERATDQGCMLSAAKAAWNAVKENPAVTKDKVSLMFVFAQFEFASHYSETLEVLKIARDEGIVLGVISNHLGFWFHEECAAPCGLRDLVAPELLLVSSEVGCSKPGNRIFELFLERLTAADCIFVDDKDFQASLVLCVLGVSSEVENVTAARALGFQGLCFNAKTAAPGALAEVWVLVPLQMVRLERLGNSLVMERIREANTHRCPAFHALTILSPHVILISVVQYPHFISYASGLVQAAEMEIRFAVAAIVLSLLHESVCEEHIVQLPLGGRLGLSTRGASSFRVRFLYDGADPRETWEVQPEEADAPFSLRIHSDEKGIDSPGLGSIAVSSEGKLRLRGPSGDVITESLPLGQLSCAAVGGRPQGGQQIAELPAASAGACCQICRARSNCTDWAFDGTNCILVKDASGWEAASGTTWGRSPGLLAFNSTSASVFGGGAGPKVATSLQRSGATGRVANRETFVPYYYTADGYAALGHTAASRFDRLLVRYQATGDYLVWSFSGDFQIYLMPAPSLLEGSRHYLSLIGRPPVPPMHAFGFLASRWGWEDGAYVEETLKSFRAGGFPLDSIIVDFEWFANTSDYDFSPEGQPWYNDFGWNPELFPSPTRQLEKYRSDFHVRVAGIRKPRLGNQELLQKMRENRWILPEGGPETYAHGRWLLFSNPDLRSWYKTQLRHYLQAGIAYWWNDEGENSYYTYHEWNAAEKDILEETQPGQRFFSLNRAFTPGLARLGAGVWTGDIDSSWQDLVRTPGMVLNWGLAGAPYVACDIGGFTGEPTPELLVRWYQVGVFMPIMRVHSAIWVKPHWPWLFGDRAAEVMREALHLRYRLIPYHYSLAHRLYSVGILWIRPLAAVFPKDPKVANLTSQWMDGEILVSPILNEASKSEVYLPEGQWHPFNRAGEIITGPRSAVEEVVPLDNIPAYVRLGTVIPLAPQVQSTDDLPGGPLEVQVYAGADGNFTLVEEQPPWQAFETQTSLRQLGVL
ncbi:Neutral alpha-glucosidase C [Symbiodinium microadriaticum]|uniref:Neutral alpha-glucosidase C n=1 Tax=Symbiodinium microadriaticum TaxID=2951 RepID=A0A1Q9EUQ2_SYMMI|nr:Neutral alpha-glucosidase C [Symbiodinium microadriaticum]